MGVGCCPCEEAGRGTRSFLLCVPGFWALRRVLPAQLRCTVAGSGLGGQQARAPQHAAYYSVLDAHCWVLQVNPCFEAPTAEMRAVLPKEIPMKQVGAGP